MAGRRERPRNSADCQTWRGCHTVALAGRLGVRRPTRGEAREHDWSTQERRRCAGASTAAVATRMQPQIERLSWNTQELTWHRRERASASRLRARASPFHARRPHRVDANRFELEQLTELPGMGKQQMMRELRLAATGPAADPRTGRATCPPARTSPTCSMTSTPTWPRAAAQAARHLP